MSVYATAATTIYILYINVALKCINGDNNNNNKSFVVVCKNCCCSLVSGYFRCKCCLNIVTKRVTATRVIVVFAVAIINVTNVGNACQMQAIYDKTP